MKKNILIFGINGELTINYVMDWLYYYSANIFKIRGDKKNELHPKIIIEEDLNNEALFLNGNNIIPSKIDKVWIYRNSPTKFLNINDSNRNKFEKFLFDFQSKEENIYLQYFFDQIPSEKWSVIRDLLYVNKLTVLNIARKNGLSTPPTMVTYSKKDLQKFKIKHQKIVVKPMSECMSFDDNKILFSIYTTQLHDETIKSQNDLLFPVLVQKEVEKVYEIRVFYLDGKCYAMAIFSQLNDATIIDWRKRRTDGILNRNVPYQLPMEIQNKIKILMQGIGLKTGSLDFIYTKDHQYIFLEVNPVGQFGMVSQQCNYYLYKKFAEFLMQ